MREALALLIPACAFSLFLIPVLPATAGLTSHRLDTVAAGLLPSLKPRRTAEALAEAGQTRRGRYPRAVARHVVSAIAVAFCLGIGFSSLTSTVLVALGISPATRGFVVADSGVWASVAALGWWTRRRWSAHVTAQSREPGAERAEPRAESLESSAESRGPSDRLDWIVRAAFGVTALVALAAVTSLSLSAPHGEWDAWAIWNQHARFLFRGGGNDTWRAFLAITWSQPDYPLLLPASVARVWAFAGHESTLGPALIAIAFGAASVALVVTTLDGRRAWIAGALILGAHTFLMQAPSQCADVPLACFIVATFAVTFGDALRGRDSGSRLPFLVAGATSAMAAWTKNEGVVFALMMLLIAAAADIRDSARAGHRPRRLLWGIAGGAPVVIAILWFKLALAPASGLIEGLSLDALVARLFDLHRHVTVAALMAQHAVRWSASFAVAVFPLLSLAAIWMAIQKGRAVRAMTAVLGLMLMSYYVVYVTTPFDISWHVSSSIDRLLVQLWPALVLAVFFE